MSHVAIGGFIALAILIVAVVLIVLSIFAKGMGR